MLGYIVAPHPVRDPDRARVSASSASRWCISHPAIRCRPCCRPTRRPRPSPSSSTPTASTGRSRCSTRSGCGTCCRAISAAPSPRSAPVTLEVFGSRRQHGDAGAVRRPAVLRGRLRHGGARRLLSGAGDGPARDGGGRGRRQPAELLARPRAGDPVRGRVHGAARQRHGPVRLRRVHPLALERREVPGPAGGHADDDPDRHHRPHHPRGRGRGAQPGFRGDACAPWGSARGR